MNTHDFLIEIGQILRGEHKYWAGDSVWNAERYVRTVAEDVNNADVIADDIDNNLTFASEISGLSPNRLQWIVNTIRLHLEK